jgi:trigger factor
MKSLISFALALFCFQSPASSNELITAAGDQVTIHYRGSVEEGQFDEGDLSVVIGSKKTVEGFEDALIGLVQDQEKTFQVTFPKNYHTVSINGKEVVLGNRQATFAIKVLKIVKK